MSKGLVFDIRRFSVHDGPGIRTTVFFKGCPMSCWWCHNPESRLPVPERSRRIFSMEGKEYPFDEMTGREMTTDEVMEEVRKDRVYYETSGGGVTFSGGEPMFQPEFAVEFAEKLKKENYHLAVDTCGYAPKEDLLRILPFADLFLFDLKLMDDAAHINYSGVSNRVIHENLEMLVRKGKKIIIRFPVIPGITDTRENVEALICFLDKINKSPNHQITKSINEIHLLPYHSLGISKYRKMNLENKLEGLKDLNNSDLDALKKEFEKRNFIVKTGG